MCDKVAPVAGNLMKALQPELDTFMTFEGVSATQAANVNALYATAYTDLSNWKDGTPSQEVLESLNDFDEAFDSLVTSLNLPAVDKVLADAILATIATIIGLITAKSPALAPPTEATASATEIAAAHAAEVSAATEAKVKILAPDFKRSVFHSAQHQQVNYWNSKVAAAVAIDPKYAVLKV